MSDVKPFSGVRVLDLTTSLAGRIASAHLGDFGADVVRAEKTVDPPLEELPAHLYANRSKRIAPLDVDTADGLQTVRRLAVRADVVVVDAPTATLERLGLDATTLRAANSGLIHCWMPGHGMRGRDNGLPADDLLLAARTGVADQQPATTDQPVALAVPILSYEQGILGATAIAAALYGRLRSARGRAVAVSGLHAVAALNGTVMVDVPGIIRPFGGSKGGAGLSPNYRAYECRDGQWIFLATLTPAHFLTLLNAIDLMEVMVLPGIDGDFANVRRPEFHAPIVGLMEARMREKDSGDWLEILRRADVPSAAVATRESWLDSETVAANAALVTLAHSELGPVRLPGVPVSLSLTPGEVRQLPGRSAVIDPAEIWVDERGGPEGSGTASQEGTVTAPEREVELLDEALEELPLRGVRVLDLGTFLAAPLAGEILVDLGATVVKGEYPGGDGYRHASATFAATNRGKQNVLIDLKTGVGRDRFLGLLPHMDIVVDNVRYGVPERLGSDYETLRKVNPAIVRCTILGWGEGPKRETPCFDPLLQASGGLMTAQAGGDQPVLYAMPVHDVAAGSLSAFGVIAALFVRERIGEGQEVRTSLTHLSLVLQAVECTRFAGAPLPVNGGRDFLGPSTTHRLYRCADGWIAVDGRKRGLRVTDLGVGPGAASGGSTVEQIELAFSSLSVEEARDRLTTAGVPSVTVLGRTGVFHDPWLAENDFYIQVEDSDVGVVQTVGGFAEWLAPPPRSMMTCRAVGEDTTVVLRQAGLLDR